MSAAYYKKICQLDYIRESENIVNTALSFPRFFLNQETSHLSGRTTFCFSEDDVHHLQATVFVFILTTNISNPPMQEARKCSFEDHLKERHTPEFKIIIIQMQLFFSFIKFVVAVFRLTKEN